jgi:hypothetical protein
LNSLFEETTINELKSRIRLLRPDSTGLWGTMTPAQALAHCAVVLEMALGDVWLPMNPVGRLFGWFMKPIALRVEMRRNSPTMKEFKIEGSRDLEVERGRVSKLLDRFLMAGPRGCSTHPHPFLGRLTPQDWSTFMYKHLDHHLRQFGV